MAVESPAPKSSVDRAAHDPRVKETVESILVAFILAFIFRGFVVEAFVIPTGSMAPTLYGAHMRLHCPDCGNTWDIGYSTGSSDDSNMQSSARLPMIYHCPNCGYAFSSDEEQRVRFGDRILVLKYQYLFSGPNRWDVVVFKSPHEDKHDPLDPDYSVNYIKRLVGLPGESVVLLDGSVYTADGKADLGFVSGFNVSGADKFTIQRRPGYAQDRLWRVINNNDFLPHLDRSSDPNQSATTWHEPWIANAGPHPWLTGDASGHPLRTFTLDDPKDGAAQAITFNADANPDTNALTDWLAYDELEQSRSGRRIPVSDLKLTCFYTRHSGDGALLMQLSKRGEVFTARITPGKVALLHGKLQQQQPMQVSDSTLVGGTEVACADLAGSGSVQVELQNVDYRVSLIVNGKTLIQTTDAEYHPDVAALYTDYKNGVSPPMPIVRIVGENQNCSLQHLTLSRNIYYLNRGDRKFWGSPDRIVHLNPGEYFVLGDNSAISADARYWDDPVKLPSEGIPFVESGRVPAEFMLGKAFFVYWPAGYAPAKTSLNIAPDFGEMRFIH
jgi:signal peptidase I